MLKCEYIYFICMYVCMYVMYVMYTTSVTLCEVRTFPPTTAAVSDGFSTECEGILISMGTRHPYIHIKYIHTYIHTLQNGAIITNHHRNAHIHTYMSAHRGMPCRQQKRTYIHTYIHQSIYLQIDSCYTIHTYTFIIHIHPQYFFFRGRSA